MMNFRDGEASKSSAPDWWIVAVLCVGLALAAPLDGAIVSSQKFGSELAALPSRPHAASIAPLGSPESNREAGLAVGGLFVEAYGFGSRADLSLSVETKTLSARFSAAGITLVPRPLQIGPYGRSEARDNQGGGNDVLSSGREQGAISATLSFPDSTGAAPRGIEPHPAQIFEFPSGASSPVARQAFRSVLYRELYPGIDLHFDQDPTGLKYRIVVGPGARLDTFAFAYDGAESAGLVQGGSLEVDFGAFVLRDARPIGWQGASFLECHFVAKAQQRFGIECPGAAPSAEFTVDPLITAELFGGSDGDLAFAVTRDSSGSLLVAGYTFSGDFPVTPNSVQVEHGLEADAYVAKFDGQGALLWATFLGGSGDDLAYGVATGDSGRVFVVGYTDSRDFPTVNPGGDPSFNGTVARGDAFVVGLSASGGTLLFTTLLGASHFEEARSITVSGTSLFVCGRTESDAFPTTPGAFQPGFQGGATDAFVARLNQTGMVEQTTLVGGPGAESCNSVISTPLGRLWIGGYTTSQHFPLAPSVSLGGATNEKNAFYGDLDWNLNSTAVGGLVGGAGDDEIVALGSVGNSTVTMVGASASSDACGQLGVPVDYHGGVSDVLAITYNVTAPRTVACALFGGSGEDRGTSLTIGPNGDVFFGGYTSSHDFQQTAGAESFAYVGGDYDGFAMQVGADSLRTIYSTFLGGSGGDYARAIRWVAPGRAVVSGNTNSSDFPEVNRGVPDALGGRSDSFLEVLQLEPSPPILNLTLGSPIIRAAAGTGGSVAVTVRSLNGYSGMSIRISSPSSSFTLGGACVSDDLVIPGTCQIEVFVPERTPVGQYAVSLEVGNETAFANATLLVTVDEPSVIQPLAVVLLVSVALFIVSIMAIVGRRRSKVGLAGDQEKNSLRRRDRRRSP
jgi:hypothetical protein